MKPISGKALSVQAIIVLGGSIHLDGALGQDTTSRVEKGIEIYKKYAGSRMNPKIIMSGAYSFLAKEKPKTLEATAMKKYAISHGVKANDILIEENSLDTLSNMFFSKMIIKKYGWRNIIIISSDFHMKRTIYAAYKVFGPGYKIQYDGSHTKIGIFNSISDTLKEFIFRLLYHIYLGNITPGDDKAIKEFLYNKHPAYKRSV